MPGLYIWEWRWSILLKLTPMKISNQANALLMHPSDNHLCLSSYSCLLQVFRGQKDIEDHWFCQLPLPWQKLRLYFNMLCNTTIIQNAHSIDCASCTRNIVTHVEQKENSITVNMNRCGMEYLVCMFMSTDGNILFLDDRVWHCSIDSDFYQKSLSLRWIENPAGVWLRDIKFTGNKDGWQVRINCFMRWKNLIEMFSPYILFFPYSLFLLLKNSDVAVYQWIRFTIRNTPDG